LDYCVREPFVSNLTVSYVSQTPAGIPAGAPAAAPAADSPLGFLAALIDQLLAGGTEAVAGTTAEAGGTVDVAGLLNAALNAKPEASTAVPAPASDLLAALTTQLDKLQARIETGEAPPPAELPKLRHAIDAMISTIDAKLAAPAEPDAPPDPVGSISTTTEVTQSATISNAAITQLLTGLGLIDPQAPPAAPAADVVAKVEPQADIAALRDRLSALAQSIAATAPDLAQKLQTLVTKLEPIAADPALAAQIGLTRPEPDPDALTIAHIIRSLLGHADAPDVDPAKIATPEPTAAANPAPQVHDDLLQVLASLGLNTPPVATTASATATADVTSAPAVQATNAVPQPLLRLSTQLSQVASELTVTAPDLAKKLEAVATRLVSTDADANVLGKITSAAAQPDETALDTLVRNQIEAKPASAPAPAAPQIAAVSERPLPAPIAPKQSKSAVTELKAAPPEPAPVTADSAPQPAPRMALSVLAHAPSGDASPEPKVEAKAAIVAEATKSDPAAQPTQPQPQAAAAPQVRALPAAYQPVANPINMGQVAFEMVRQVHLGTSRFTIRLDPPEMGRVDVRMHVDASGAVNARLTVDRAETLDLFQRDRQSLERALSQAGLDTSKTNLEFSLRQQHHNPFAGMMGGDQRQQPGGNGAPRFSLSGNDEVASVPAITLYRGTASAGGVNIFA
jgi:flagellar hook-length control protein FliK